MDQDQGDPVQGLFCKNSKKHIFNNQNFQILTEFLLHNIL